MTWVLGGISDVELLILYELWAGERFQFQKAVPRCMRVDRAISVSAVPIGPGIDFRRSCKLLGAMLRALCVLLGGLGRFHPCAIGANHGRHIGWDKSGHGLTSRLRELLMLGSWMSCFFSLVTLRRLGMLLLRGTLLLRYCTSRFAHKVPTWSLPVSGGVALLEVWVMMVVCWCVLILPVLIMEGSEMGLGFLDLGLRESDFGEKPVHEVFRESLGCHSRPRVWKRLKFGVSLFEEDGDAGRRQLHDHLDFRGPVHDRTGIG